MVRRSPCAARLLAARAAPHRSGLRARNAISATWAPDPVAVGVPPSRLGFSLLTPGPRAQRSRYGLPLPLLPLVLAPDRGPAAHKVAAPTGLGRMHPLALPTDAPPTGRDRPQKSNTRVQDQREHGRPPNANFSGTSLNNRRQLNLILPRGIGGQEDRIGGTPRTRQRARSDRQCQRGDGLSRSWTGWGRESVGQRCGAWLRPQQA